MSVETEEECFYCCQPAKEKCPHCFDQVYYCSLDHLAFHRPKAYCFPFKVRQNVIKGRYLVAVRELKPFELVAEESSYFVTPSRIKEEPKCCVCLCGSEDATLLQCPKCQVAICRNCLENYPQAHSKFECRILSQAETIERKEALLLPLRLLATKRNDTAMWNQISRLETHADRRGPMLTNEEIAALPDGEDGELSAMVGAVRTNSVVVGVRGGAPGRKAQALFPSIFSLLSHDCMSNCRFATESTSNAAKECSTPTRGQKDDAGNDRRDKQEFLAKRSTPPPPPAAAAAKVQIRAKRRIGKGEELCIQYTSSLMGNSERCPDIRKKWLFDCRCRWCTDPTELGSFLSAVRCVDCGANGNGFLLPQSPAKGDGKGGEGEREDQGDHRSDLLWKCCGCQRELANGETHPRDVVEEFKRIIQGTSYLEPLEVWESLLAEISGRLHPNHYLAMDVKRVIIQMIGNRKDLHPLSSLEDKLVQRKLNLCQNYLEVYSRVDPGLTKWRGHLLEEIIAPMVLLMRRKSERGECVRADYDAAVKEGFRMLRECLKSRSFEEGGGGGIAPDSAVAVIVKEFNDIIAAKQSDE